MPPPPHPPEAGLPLDSCMQCLTLLHAWTLCSFPVFLYINPATRVLAWMLWWQVDVGSVRPGLWGPRTARVNGSSLWPSSEAVSGPASPARQPGVIRPPASASLRGAKGVSGVSIALFSL